ncbi:MAG TPA: hypothetical protein PKA00_07310 [Saprospiraceae bacterium]|nr:hypothetical protein [Saprospiraceae bacterium]HMQ82698.1 hypothetical protein [Saprospiraceae bacterium]
MKRLLFLSFIFLFYGNQTSFSQTEEKYLITEKLILDMPLLDAPFMQYAAQMAYNKRTGQTSDLAAQPTANDWLRGYESPSMSQVLAITKDLHATNYYFQNKLWNKWLEPENGKKHFLNRLAANATAGVVDYLLAYNLMVFGPVWMHEEFHRNGLTLQGISSFDDTYYRFGGDGTPGGSVTQVSDEDLIRFKAEAPEALVRTFAAGIEGQYAFVRNLQKDNFYHDTDYPNVVMNILITKQAVDYVRQFQQSDYDASIDTMNAYGKLLEERDFVGWDFTPWVYDLHRPDEPYTFRGQHPQGQGINRAIKRSQLSEEEDAYLVKMGNLQYLNYISPSMLGVHSIRFNDQLRFNFAVRHILTSFGYDLGGDLLINHRGNNWLLGFHTYHNHENVFAGIEIERQGIKANLGSKALDMTARVMAWVQPENEGFYASKGQTGGLMQVRAHLPLSDSFNVYAEAEGKTRGWVWANPYLQPNFSLRMGLLLNLEQ